MEMQRWTGWRCLLASVLANGLLQLSAAATDWPWWRGPAHSGVVDEASGWPQGWPPQRLWKQHVGFGCTSPIIAAGSLYVMGWSGAGSGRPGGNPVGTDTVYCFDVHTGRELWRQSYRCRYQGRLRTGDTAAYGGPSSTPSFEAATGRLYTLSVDGDLQCWDTTQSGRRVWNLNLYDRFPIDQRPDVGGGRRDYGFPGSPLIYGDWIVVEVGARQGLLMAFDKGSGDRRWVSSVNEPAGHCAGPVPLTVDSIPCLATLALKGLVVVRADAGHEGQGVGRYPWATEFACNIATPAVAGSRLLITSGYNHKQMALIDVSPQGLKQIWATRQHAVVGSPVVFGDNVYTVAGKLQCTELATGDSRWAGGGSFGHGSCLITAPDRKVIVFGNGRLVLAEAEPHNGGYTELSRLDRVVRGTCYPHVTLADGMLSCKDRDGHLVCFSVAPRQPKTGAASSPPAETQPVAAVAAGDPVSAWAPSGSVRVTTRGKARVSDRGMVLAKGACLADESVAKALFEQCRQRHQLSLEAAFTPANLSQGGPARIISFSQDPYHRNFTLGQEKQRLILRLRTPRTGENGTGPQTDLCPLQAGVEHHIVISYRPGHLVCHLNGEKVLDTNRVQGDFSNWSLQHLLFGDEWSGERDWAGTLSQVVIEATAVDEDEARKRYRQYRARRRASGTPHSSAPAPGGRQQHAPDRSGTPAAEVVGAAGGTWPSRGWSEVSPTEVGMDPQRLRQARDYALTGGGSGLITRHGRAVLAWGDQSRRYDLKSSTKAIGVTALGLAIGDGKMRLDDPAVKYHPEFGVPPESNRQTGWLPRITLRHLATQTAGFEKPGGYTRLIFAPGSKWSYSDGGPNWLAECVTLVYRRDLQELMFERIFTPLGITRKDLTWRRNSYRPAEIDGIMRREFGSGISANVDAMTRIGYLYLREGRWRGRQLLSAGFVRHARSAVEGVVGLPEVDPQRHGNASDHYGLLWWNNADGTLTAVPRDAYWSWGLYDSLILVIPSLDVVAARAGRSWQRRGGIAYDVLRPFVEPIVLAVKNGPKGSGGNRGAGGPGGMPYPASPVIRAVTWAPAGEIARQARGSDNWPLTWGDDDALYAAYGDGWGFEPRTREKLSLGLARITGVPPDVRGSNIRTVSGEQRGDGASGRKASGMLMVDGVLYMLVRNAHNAQLAWSADHGGSWTWANWRFTTSFGCPTFLNFGRNYAGARDDFVYVYSPDTDSAYRRADRMVLARVPRDRIRHREAYEFLHDINAAGQPQWTPDIEARGAVFTHAGHCYRSSVSYNAGLQRYLWCQTGTGSALRSSGGLAIYDAPEPWGPWTTAYATVKWDVGPGESSSFPTKWMSADGRTIHLAFSGDDCFSVRRAVLTVADGRRP